MSEDDDDVAEKGVHVESICQHVHDMERLHIVLCIAQLVRSGDTDAALRLLEEYIQERAS